MAKEPYKQAKEFAVEMNCLLGLKYFDLENLNFGLIVQMMARLSPINQSVDSLKSGAYRDLTALRIAAHTGGFEPSTLVEVPLLEPHDGDNKIVGYIVPKLLFTIPDFKESEHGNFDELSEVLS